jgi:hypothetical protein
MTRQYKPNLSVRHSPRVTRQFRAIVNRICKRWKMPEAEVLRYSFEAAVLTSGKRLKRTASSDPVPLDEMVTVRTTREIDRLVRNLWRKNPSVLKYDIIRALLENMILMAKRHGMAQVMKLREEALIESV